MLRAYTPDVLNFQQFTYFCIINTEGFETGTNNGDMNVHYEGLVVGQGSPNHRDVCRGRHGNDSRFYLSDDVVGYCVTAIRSYLNLVDIKTGYFHHLNEVLTGHMGDLYPSAYGRHISGN